MIRSNVGRQVLLISIALVFGAIAIRTLLSPEPIAAELGYTLVAPNGYSELFAVYVGVWLATASLCVLAAVRVRQPLFGDLLAMFELAQPLGRLLALPQFGLPQGPLLAFFVVEVAGGLALLAVRPSA
ncbi:MAG: DUF4345 family protein [Pseudomonadota bacterium]|nr:DUF4345 family protein [Pseudomonadota bacterium]